jgi:hypothetical protein
LSLDNLTFMFLDNLEAYVNARIDQALHAHNGVEDWPEQRALRETSSIRKDGLLSIHKLIVKEAAAAEPHNPFSINDDVNQPDHEPSLISKPTRTPTPPPPIEDN